MAIGGAAAPSGKCSPCWKQHYSSSFHGSGLTHRQLSTALECVRWLKSDRIERAWSVSFSCLHALMFEGFVHTRACWAAHFAGPATTSLNPTKFGGAGEGRWVHQSSSRSRDAAGSCKHEQGRSQNRLVGKFGCDWSSAHQTTVYPGRAGIAGSLFRSAAFTL